MSTMMQKIAPATDGIPTAPAGPVRPRSPVGVMSITVVRDLASLQQHVTAWNDLAAHALEPNAYYEPWMCLPAIELCAPGLDLRHVLVYSSDPKQPQQPPLLCGYFPLQQRRSYKGFPVSCLSLWEYGNCFLSTPLVREQHARECLTALFDWLAADPESSPLLELRQIAGEGPVYQHLVEQLWQRGSLTYALDGYTRALLRRRHDADAYLQAALSANKRRDLQRKQRRLQEIGRLEYLTLGRDGDIESWIESFLRLEAAGWKGKEGTALACRQADPHFFRVMARRGFERGQLSWLALHLDGQPIAMRCSFVSKPGSFFYKPAYNEEYARYSPGVLLELETIRQLHADPALQWMDSCTDPDNGLLNALWLDRKIIHSLLVATGRGMGRLVVSTLPLFRWLNRKVGRYRPPVLKAE